MAMTWVGNESILRMDRMCLGKQRTNSFQWIALKGVVTLELEAGSFNASLYCCFRLEKQEHCIIWEMFITLKGKMWLVLEHMIQGSFQRM